MGKFFDNNVFIKIISVLIALLLWLYVMSEQNPAITRTFTNVTVKPVELDTSKLVLKDDSNKLEVTVRVRGRRSSVSRVGIDDIDAWVDLRGRMEGQNLIPVNVKVPENVELLEVVPKEIMVDLDAVVEKQLPVEVRLKGTVAAGYTTNLHSVRPKDILIQGPRTTVNSVVAAVVNIELKNSDKDITGAFPVRVLDGTGKEVKGITFRPDIVEVTVPVVPYKPVAVEPALSGKQAPGFTVTGLTVEPATVDVTGPRSRLQELTSIPTEAIDISGATETKRATVNLMLPRDLALVNGDNPEVDVTVNIEKEVMRQLELRTGVSVLNLPDSLVAPWEPVDFKIQVAAAQSVAKLLNPEDVQLFADAARITEPGNYALDVKVELPKAYRLVEIQPNTVRIELSRIQ